MPSSALEHELRLCALADELDQRAMKLLADLDPGARLGFATARGLAEAAIKARRAAGELAREREERTYYRELMEHERAMISSGRRDPKRPRLRMRGETT